jgi:hypothetical protein
MLAEARVEGLEMPIARLLRRQNDPTLPEAYRDQLAIATAPYTAPRLSAVAVTRRPGQMTDEEISKMLGIVTEDLLRAGEGRGDHYPYAIEHQPNGSDDEVKH